MIAKRKPAKKARAVKKPVKTPTVVRSKEDLRDLMFPHIKGEPPTTYGLLFDTICKDLKLDAAKHRILLQKLMVDRNLPPGNGLEAMVKRDEFRRTFQRRVFNPQMTASSFEYALRYLRAQKAVLTHELFPEKGPISVELTWADGTVSHHAIDPTKLPL